MWIEDSFEAAARSCAFFGGFLAGFLSKLFNKDISVVEEKHNKEKKHCEFKFASSFALYGEEARRTRDRIIKEMSLKRRYY